MPGPRRRAARSGEPKELSLYERGRLAARSKTVVCCAFFGGAAESTAAAIGDAKSCCGDRLSAQASSTCETVRDWSWVVGAGCHTAAAACCFVTCLGLREADAAADALLDEASDATEAATRAVSRMRGGGAPVTRERAQPTGFSYRPGRR